MALGEILSRLSVELSLNSAAFEQNAKRAGLRSAELGDRMERMGERVGKAGKAIAVAGLAVAGSFVVNQIKDMALEGLKYASSLGETAQQLGVAASALQEFRFIASQNGVTQEEMDKGLQKLTRTIGLAATGNKAAIKAFADLGVNVRDAAGNIKATDIIFAESADGLAKLDSSAEQMARGNGILGKSFAQLLPIVQLGGDAIRVTAKEARDFGLVLSDKQIADADKTADKITKLQSAFNIRVAGVVSSNSAEIGAMADELANLVDKLFKFIEIMRKIDRTPVGKVTRFLNESSGYFSPAGVLGKAAGFAIDEYDARTAAPAAKKPAAAPVQSRNLNAGLVGTNSKFRRGGLAAGLAGKGNFATGGDQFDAGRGLANLAALAGQAEATGGRLVPVLNKIAGATAAVKDEFTKLSPAVQSLFEQLFPREAADREYEEGLKALRVELDKGKISLERFEEARRRLSAASFGLEADNEFTATAYDDVEPLVANLEAVESGLYRFKKSLATNADAAEITNVRIATSFEDMAQATLASLNQVAGAVKGGGFLNILSSVIGLGLQLGGVGAFGSTIAGRINAPQLVPVGRGTTVSPPKAGAGGGKSLVEIVDTTGLFVTRVNGQIMRASPAIMAGGASVAQAKLTYRNTRRVG